MPVHVQMHPPRSMKAFDLLKSAGADTLGIHIEVCDTESACRYDAGKGRPWAAGLYRCMGTCGCRFRATR